MHQYERESYYPLNRYSGREVIRLAAGLVSVLGREITGNSEGVGTEGLLGNVGGFRGCDGGQRLEGIGWSQKVYRGKPKDGS